MRVAPRIVRLPYALLAAAGLASTALALPPPAAAPALSPYPQGTPLLACPTTRDYVGRVVATVTVDGKGPFRFIIDTGANESTISPKLAAALGLAPSAIDPLRVAGVTGTAIVPSVPIQSLRVGALAIAHTNLPVIWSPIMGGTDGILGAAGLGGDILFVDFRHDTVEIRPADGAVVPAGYTRVMGGRLSGGLLSLAGEVGQVPVTAIIDTGSPQTLGNLALFRALYSHSQAGGKPVTALVYGATKQVRAGRVKPAPTIEFGAVQIANPVLVFGDFPIFKVWGLMGRPAIILGMDALGTVDAFSINFQNAEIDVAAPRVYEPTAYVPVTG